MLTLAAPKHLAAAAPALLAAALFLLAGQDLLAALGEGAVGSRSSQDDSGQDRASEESSEGEAENTPDNTLNNTLRWKTASEVDNFGFDVYRGDSQDGPFERLTEQPIPGAGTTDEPQQYVFVDDTIEPGRAYWYYVESISMMGIRERFTPVFRAKVKGGDEGRDEASQDAGANGSEGGSEEEEGSDDGGSAAS